MIRFITLLLLCGFVLASPAAAQRWRYTGSLHTARRMFSTTLLHDGRVMVIGGTNQQGSTLNSCELYDARTEQWTLTAPMRFTRARHTATLLDDGRVVVTGGNTASDGTSVVTAAVEIFDPVTGKWSSGGNLLMARQNHTATLLRNGTILVTGGYNGNYLAQCELYDPGTGRSTLTSPLFYNRMDHQAMMLADGNVLAVGGRTGGWDGNFMNQSEIYNVSTGKWTTIEPMPESRISGFALVRFSDASVLAAGGRSTSTATTAGAEVLDPATRTWRPVDPMKVPVSWPGCMEMPFDGYLLTGGFYDALWYTDNIITATAACQWYDKRHGRWYYAPKLNMQRGEHGAVFLHDCGNPLLPRDLALVAGGITGPGSITATAEVLDITLPALDQYIVVQDELAGGAADAPTTPATPLLTVTGNPGDVPVVLFSTNREESVKIDLVASDGHLVATIADEVYGPGEHRQPVNVAGLPNGVYFVRMRSASASGVEKFVVVR